jgi:adenosylcobyric acid synthase
MVQGTASHAGKSVITTALCRWLVRAGLRVAPFKAQNMSLNSAVAEDGGEIGRSQAFQAAACGIPAETAMNPVLLKPMSGGRCQVVVKGQPYCIAGPDADPEAPGRALEVAAECLTSLRRRFDVVVLEGMGSPAEINLRGRETANMPVAALASSPVLLVGDIEHGGVFASLAGTLALLEPADRARVRGLLINKFWGDPAVLLPGTLELERRYGAPTLGVLPWLRDLHVDEEDAVSLTAAPAPADGIEVLVPRLPSLSNFTDLHPLEREPGVQVRYVERAAQWGNPALVVLPGSRSVAADLEWLRWQGLAERIVSHARSGGRVIGVCGGYQMLGREIRDPQGVEGPECLPGLGLLDVTTTFLPHKTLLRVTGASRVPGLEGLPVEGYEIHHGVTAASGRPAFDLSGRPDGAATEDGRVFGGYLHGLFDLPAFRHALLRLLGGSPAAAVKPAGAFDRLADWLEAHADMDRILDLVLTSPALP